MFVVCAFLKFLVLSSFYFWMPFSVHLFVSIVFPLCKYNHSHWIWCVISWQGIHPQVSYPYSKWSKCSDDFLGYLYMNSSKYSGLFWCMEFMACRWSQYTTSNVDCAFIYTGKTGATIRTRTSEHKKDIHIYKKKNYLQSEISKHTQTTQHWFRWHQMFNLLNQRIP